MFIYLYIYRMIVLFGDSHTASFVIDNNTQ